MRIDCYLVFGIGEGQCGVFMCGIIFDGKGKVYFVWEVENWYVLDIEIKLLDIFYLYDCYGNYFNFNDSQGIWYDKEGFFWGVIGDGID